MPPAARQLDATNHPGIISACVVPSVRINAMPAATVGAVHTCLFPPLAGPHPSNTVVKGSLSVKIGKQAAARQNDLTGCGAMIATGSFNVFIGG